MRSLSCCLLLALVILAVAPVARAARYVPPVERSVQVLRPEAAAQPEPKRHGLRPALSSMYVSTGGAAAAFKPGAIVVRRNGLSAGDTEDFDDYDSAPAKSIADPLEPWNRFWFRFNDLFFTYVAKPAYRGWEAITHEDIRSGLGNFFHHVMFPVRFVNNILQFRFLEAGVEFGRFIVNTTTSAGFADITKNKKTIVPVDPTGEDFGQTLGRWGIGHGFYLVWPFLGPSSLRETVGRVGDLFADPFFYLSPWPIYHELEIPWYASGTARGFLYFNDMGAMFPAYDSMKSASVDPYIAVREAWVKRRAMQVAR